MLSGQRTEGKERRILLQLVIDHGVRDGKTHAVFARKMLVIDLVSEAEIRIRHLEHHPVRRVALAGNRRGITLCVTHDLVDGIAGVVEEHVKFRFQIHNDRLRNIFIIESIRRVILDVMEVGIMITAGEERGTQRTHVRTHCAGHLEAEIDDFCAGNVEVFFLHVFAGIERIRNRIAILVKRIPDAFLRRKFPVRRIEMIRAVCGIQSDVMYVVRHDEGCSLDRNGHDTKRILLVFDIREFAKFIQDLVASVPQVIGMLDAAALDAGDRLVEFQELVAVGVDLIDHVPHGIVHAVLIILEALVDCLCADNKLICAVHKLGLVGGIRRVF